jgi:ubiquinone/menaquinone biosynthesis C-methylase UbiE
MAMNQNQSSDQWTSPDPRVVAEWIEERDRTDRMFAPFGERMLDRAALTPGEVVLDLGCGTGATTFVAWQRVKPNGNVTGIDVSPTMLEAARARVRDLANARIAWVQGDIQTYPFLPGAADVAISRFGVAHVASAPAAFVNVRHALRPGGRFVFTEWAARAENEWMSFVDDVTRRVLPEVFADTSDAIEYAADFANGQRLWGMLENAGFEVQSFERYRGCLWLGSSPSEVVAWFARLPEGRVLETLDSTARQRLLAGLEEELAQRTRPDGVYLAGTAWIVACRVP